ncbi:MAG: hypothetical protein SGCHY_005574 [Lobulomycetales sp.]
MHRMRTRRLFSTRFSGLVSDTQGAAQFSVTRTRGFLPIDDPLVSLPSPFGALESLLSRMPLTLSDGTPGLLAQGKFGDAVLAELPLIDTSDIKDQALLTALFRDYTFAASAYLLEPCDLNMRKSGSYGLGRQILPKQLAVPLASVSEKIGAKPFMEYAQSYALYNYQKTSPEAPLTFPNLKLIRSFQNSVAETGFILVHVAMVAYSGHLVSASVKVLDAAAAGDRAAFNRALGEMIGAMRKINQVMETMWGRSRSNEYKSFRTFIMGTKNQPMFPNGVLYEGVSETPTFFRGESGANDSIIPTCDNILCLTQSMPDNPLTSILKDFRSYRPASHNAWLDYTEARAKEVGVDSYARKDVHSSALLLAALDQVREFRDRHWRFTKQYILKHSSHPVATGGSPIVSWLPNQLAVVLDRMTDLYAHISRADLASSGTIDVFDARLEGEEFTADAVSSVAVGDVVQECGERAAVESRVLAEEVEALGKIKGREAVQAESRFEQ